MWTAQAWYGGAGRGMETAIFNPDNLARLGEDSPGKPRHGAVGRGMECHWQGVAVCGEQRQGGAGTGMEWCGSVRKGEARSGEPGFGRAWLGTERRGMERPGQVWTGEPGRGEPWSGSAG